jgi:calcineurin-like phosphoesterase family protein
MDKIRYIADLHLGHANIIKFDQRPFFNIKDMEETIVSNWNSVVKRGDVTYILGDFCLGTSDEWRRLLRLLNGSKALILGNHDLKNIPANIKAMFQDIKDYKEITDSGKRIIMCHYPMLFYRSAYDRNCIMLCGHVHDTRENNFLNIWKAELQRTKLNKGDNCGSIYNVGCMLPYMNYTPRTIDEILRSDEMALS